MQTGCGCRIYDGRNQILSLLYEIDNFEEADLKEEAEDYLRSIGLTDEQLDALADKLTDPAQD